MGEADVADPGRRRKRRRGDERRLTRRFRLFSTPARYSLPINKGTRP
jgi:hypothetical protein